MRVRGKVETMLGDTVMVSINPSVEVKVPTRLKDLKVGDVIMAAELYRIDEIRDKNWILCTSINPTIKCTGFSHLVHHTGWGQSGVLKVTRGVALRSLIKPLKRG